MSTALPSIRTKIFVDSGDPAETRAVLQRLGRLDGQTTNPSNVAKSPAAQARLARGQKFSRAEVWQHYRGVVSEISHLIPQGSVSIEVYANVQTTSQEMLAQAKQMYAWIPNAHIKFPITAAGLATVEASVRQGMRVNLTLCFSLDQAAAVYAATLGATRGQVFLSPFVGRFDDRGESGLDLVDQVTKLYASSDGHVLNLAASIRHPYHLVRSLELGADILTVPAKVLLAWADAGFPTSSQGMTPPRAGLRPLPNPTVALGRPWQEYNLQHDRTDAGIAKFAADWDALIAYG